MEIIGIILFISTITLFFAIMSFDLDILGLVGFIITGLLLLLSLHCAVESKSKPTEKDVLEGKATYQETLHVIGNDTVKTYKIIWKNTCSQTL